ncbi:MAG: hypothetical protein GY832_23570 [Chloroflexi bacterium]|nr:hypothetical protein [Chloroflexota bacterium]
MSDLIKELMRADGEEIAEGITRKYRAQLAEAERVIGEVSAKLDEGVIWNMHNPDSIEESRARTVRELYDILATYNPPKTKSTNPHHSESLSEYCRDAGLTPRGDE